MRAPVYRHLDTKATFAGLTFPAEWMIVICVTFVLAVFDLPTVGMVAGACVYFGLRGAGYGKPDSHVQYYGMWRIRAWWSGGRFSSAARGLTPRFPHAQHIYRDVPKRGV